MKNKVLLLLFVGLLIGLAIYNIPFSPKKPVKKSPAVEEQKKAEENLEFETVKRKHLAEGWGRNPFFRGEERAPLPSEKTPGPTREVKALPLHPIPSLKLEMIFTVDAQKVAILGGQYVKEGDKVGEEVVVKINSDKVILKKNGKQRAIKLDPFSNHFQTEERRP